MTAMDHGTDCPRPARRAAVLLLLVLFAGALPARASVGDAQVKTDHPWYPGELSCSTSERLFQTQAEAYMRATGREVKTDEDKALASWYWRNLHFAHGEEGAPDCFGRGFGESGPSSRGEWNREYWTGLFAHGFALCGATHAQYSAEINRLLGHGKARCVGVEGHNSFEVFLADPALTDAEKKAIEKDPSKKKPEVYGKGRWALLDHDLSTVVFSPDGKRLLPISEIIPQLATLKDPSFKPERQRGWRVAGLHDGDASVFTAFRTVEYFPGYAGPPPMVHLRRGESVRRYLEPGLEDRRTFVFWGRNYNTAGVPGPERSRSWVNQPEKMHGSKEGAGHKDGRVRYANAVYTYTPDFADGSYREGVIDEGPGHVTFEFYTPYVIGATPANDGTWGVYDDGAKNGLVVTGKVPTTVAVSTDQGKTWTTAGPPASAGIDLTDPVKGHNQYWLRFDAGADALKDAGLTWRTVCQTNVATIPRLHDGTNRIHFYSGGRALVSAGPNRDQAEAHVVAGAMDSPSVTLELKPPRGEKAVRLYAASWQASGSPPSPDVKYAIDYSLDGGRTWKEAVKDWKIVRREPEPHDFWSQSFCWGDVGLDKTTKPVRVRFTNSGGKPYRKVEAHLVYEVQNPTAATVTFAWSEAGGATKTASRDYAGLSNVEDMTWRLDAGRDVKTLWVEYAARP
jgi:hypothetical protein